MANNIGLPQNTPVFARRAVSANSQVLPATSGCILNKDGGSGSDAWGLALLALLDTGAGFLWPPGKKAKVWAPGNTGTIEVQFYNPVSAAWETLYTISDAEGHEIDSIGRAMRVTTGLGWAGASAINVSYEQ
jgi:hypothetical protein